VQGSHADSCQIERQGFQLLGNCIGTDNVLHETCADRCGKLEVQPGKLSAEAVNCETDERGQVVGVFPLDTEQHLKADREDDGVRIPYYMPCQQLKKQQQQQQQQQQKQQALALWWQAYLSGLYSGYGLASVPSSSGSPPVVSTLSCMPVPSRWVLKAGSTGNQMQHVQDDDEEQTDEFGCCGQKRIRMDTDIGSVKMRVSKKGRKRAEDRVCSNCGTRATPFWRKDKHSGKPLCNACGLYFSKNDVPRPLALWRNAGGSVDP